MSSEAAIEAAPTSSSGVDTKAQDSAEQPKGAEGVVEEESDGKKLEAPTSEQAKASIEESKVNTTTDGSADATTNAKDTESAEKGKTAIDAAAQKPSESEADTASDKESKTQTSDTKSSTAEAKEDVQEDAETQPEDDEVESKKNTENEKKPLDADDSEVVSTDIVIVGGAPTGTLAPWDKSGTGLRCLHKNEDATPQHEAALFEAAYTDNVDLAQKMIDLKVNVNCRRHKGRTPLHYCALSNGLRVAKVCAREREIGLRTIEILLRT